MKPQKKDPASGQLNGDETTTAASLDSHLTAVNTTIGDSRLCAWLVAKGVVWVQSRDPEFTKQLHRRKDGRLVARGVAGGYLRTYEFPHGLSWAAALIDRYTGSGRCANWRLTLPKGDSRRFDSKKVSGHHPENPARPAAF